jgi:hypothetical protein
VAPSTGDAIPGPDEPRGRFTGLQIIGACGSFRALRTPAGCVACQLSVYQRRLDFSRISHPGSGLL